VPQLHEFFACGVVPDGGEVGPARGREHLVEFLAPIMLDCRGVRRNGSAGLRTLRWTRSMFRVPSPPAFTVRLKALVERAFRVGGRSSQPHDDATRGPPQDREEHWTRLTCVHSTPPATRSQSRRRPGLPGPSRQRSPRVVVAGQIESARTGRTIHTTTGVRVTHLDHEMLRCSGDRVLVLRS
jgi:hypothetical protein